MYRYYHGVLKWGGYFIPVHMPIFIPGLNSNTCRALVGTQPVMNRYNCCLKNPLLFGYSHLRLLSIVSVALWSKNKPYWADHGHQVWGFVRKFSRCCQIHLQIILHVGMHTCLPELRCRWCGWKRKSVCWYVSISPGYGSIAIFVTNLSFEFWTFPYADQEKNTRLSQ